jgi:hypothetical protein
MTSLLTRNPALASLTVNDCDALHDENGQQLSKVFNSAPDNRLARLTVLRPTQPLATPVLGVILEGCAHLTHLLVQGQAWNDTDRELAAEKRPGVVLESDARKAVVAATAVVVVEEE